LDSSDNVFVTGDHAGECFYEQLYYWAFVSKVDKDLTTLLGQKCIGETCSYYASGSSLALDTKGNVYFAGVTYSEDFPTTSGAYDRTFAEGEAFISKLNGNLYVPITLTVASPNGGESWVAGTVHDITWESTGKISEVRIELSTDNGATWSDKTVSPARYHTYSWTVPNTPSRQCLVRISDNDHPAITDTSDAVFSILMNIDLLAERREARAFSIVRQYGRIQFLIGNASVQVSQYHLMRRKGGEDFILLKEIAPSELHNNQFQMQDKYLEKGAAYTYRVEAYDAAGQLIGVSMEKTI
jgi:hypothetical protein